MQRIKALENNQRKIFDNLQKLTDLIVKLNTIETKIQIFQQQLDAEELSVAAEKEIQQSIQALMMQKLKLLEQLDSSSISKTSDNTKAIYGRDDRHTVEEEPDMRVRKVAESVCAITYTMNAGKTNNNVGTGFLVAKDLILTCHHCIKFYNHKDKNGKPYGIGIYSVEFYDEFHRNVKEIEVYPCEEIISFSFPKLDYALIRIGEGGSRFSKEKHLPRMTPLTLSDTEPKKGDNLVVVGHPQGLQKQVSNNARVTTDNKPKKGRNPSFGANCDTFKGNSGSPVFYYTGKNKELEVFGLLWGGMPDKKNGVDAFYDYNSESAHENFIPMKAILDHIQSKSSDHYSHLHLKSKAIARERKEIIKVLDEALQDKIVAREDFTKEHLKEIISLSEELDNATGDERINIEEVLKLKLQKYHIKKVRMAQIVKRYLPVPPEKFIQEDLSGEDVKKIKTLLQQETSTEDEIKKIVKQRYIGNAKLREKLKQYSMTAKDELMELLILLKSVPRGNTSRRYAISQNLRELITRADFELNLRKTVKKICSTIESEKEASETGNARSLAKIDVNLDEELQAPLGEAMDLLNGK
ncbi:trypsin-like serine peptidase [Candidatus Uabimicrobium amorphum]|uniref:trypsin-like serine peptidase n=1 Tax=Uabimicrobium amorphum TaxID=2596890 RepID=UPI00156666C2|nr:serine protease [Candidatus Uabimicrobium amorphum]